VLQVVADSESRFIFIDPGTCGKQSDGGTFSATTLYHFLEDSEATFKKPASVGRSGTEMPFAILGDEACPLKTINEAFREKGCHVKNVFSITGCREEGGALSIHFVP
jgi:hypothetical protein